MVKPKKEGVEISKRKHVYVIEVNVPKPTDGWSHWFLLQSDVHFDSPECRRAQVLEHMQEAKDLGGHILRFGDSMDATQGPHDPRQSAAGKDPEDQGIEAYYDRLVERAVAFHAPFAEQMLFSAMGNHETSILIHSGTDLNERCCRWLREQHQSAVLSAPYRGYIRFLFNFYGSERYSRLLLYEHGRGKGSATRSKGLLDADIRQCDFGEADFYVSGHNHNSWTNANGKEHVSQAGAVDVVDAWHINVPSYRNEEKWEQRRGARLKPVHGAYWLQFGWRRGKFKMRPVAAW